MKRTRRRPSVFELDETEYQETVLPEEDDIVLPAPPLPQERRGWSWWSLVLAGVSGLATLALSLSLTAFVMDLFARSPILGTVAGALAVLTLVGLFGVGLREWLALRRLSEVSAIRAEAEDAVREDDAKLARDVLTDLITLYSARPATAAGRKALEGHMRQVIDGRDLVGLGEREILVSLDKQALAEIVSASRQVAAVTALSPRALVDVAFVVFASLKLIRRVATIYGGRPGTLGFFRVARLAVAQLLVTGSMAVGESMIGELVGQGLAARLSAKLGEGIVNGLMTARLGLATMDVLRPLPFVDTRRPRVNDVLVEIGRVVPRDNA
ncbi:MAG: TIGR01620 family protein [Pseudomonadota bacterium]